MVTFVRRGAGMALAVLMLAGPVLAQESADDVKRQIEALKQGQQEILKQLEEIKKLVAARPAAPAPPAGPNVKDVVFNLGNNPVRGSADARVTLVEFTDYQ
jgi:protein-disulfide isomerase